MEEFFTDFALPAAMWLTVLAAIAAIVLPLISLAGDPKSLLKTLAGVAFIAVSFSLLAMQWPIPTQLLPYATASIQVP